MRGRRVRGARPMTGAWSVPNGRAVPFSGSPSYCSQSLPRAVDTPAFARHRVGQSQPVTGAACGTETAADRRRENMVRTTRFHVVTRED